MPLSRFFFLPPLNNYMHIRSFSNKRFAAATALAQDLLFQKCCWSKFRVQLFKSQNSISFKRQHVVSLGSKYPKCNSCWCREGLAWGRGFIIDTRMTRCTSKRADEKQKWMAISRQLPAVCIFKARLEDECSAFWFTASSHHCIHLSFITLASSRRLKRYSLVFFTLWPEKGNGKMIINNKRHSRAMLNYSNKQMKLMDKKSFVKNFTTCLVWTQKITSVLVIFT